MLLKSVKIVAFVLCGSVSFSADRAQADEHVIIILDSAYFPYRTAIAEGDTIRFVNVSGATLSVTHVDGLWTTPPMKEGQEMIVNIDPEMVGKYFGWTTRRITGELEYASRMVTN